MMWGGMKVVERHVCETRGRRVVWSGSLEGGETELVYCTRCC
jgi:hypothetical protein